MISQTFRIARMVVLASFALSSAAWAATCSHASLSGTYGFLHGGTDRAGQPTTVSQVTFDSTTGTLTAEDTASHNGVITTDSLTGTYAVASNCTVAATIMLNGASENRVPLTTVSASVSIASISFPQSTATAIR